MSEDASEINPYAPPRAETGEPRRGKRKGARAHGRRDIREALERLEEHLADREATAYDRKVAGRRVRVITIVFSALFVLSLPLVVTALDGKHDVMLPLSVLLAALSAILGGLLLFMDLALVDRGKPSAPEASLKAFYKAISMGRMGYAWAALSPTAREQSVYSPTLEPVMTAGGEFSLEDQAGLKAYTGTFARPGQNQIRTVAVKRISVRSFEAEDVAEVDVLLAFQSWPQWVSIVLALGAFLFRPIILVGGILYFVMRKRREVEVTKTLLRGSNGVWYLLDGNLVEGLEEA
jgi:hypothetical protein